MRILRKFLSALMGLVALFFAVGDVVATPGALWVAVLFGLLAVALAAGAWFTWPRRIRPWRLDAMLAGH